MIGHHGPERPDAYPGNPLDVFPAADETGSVEPVREGPRARVAAPLHLQQKLLEDALAGQKLVGHHEFGPHVEEYRRLSASLHQLQLDRGVKRVMVTSARVGEGKTLTAANLSLTLSESYRRRVLLVDADLRHPSVAALLHVPDGPGLTDCLRVDEGRPLRLVRVSDFLTVLPSGAPDPDPMAILTSPRMHRILDEAASEFDWIVIDTPPVALLPDARLLTSIVEAIVFVIEAASTPFAMVRHALDALGPDKIAGVVLNRVADNVLNETGYEYYGYYARPRTRRRRWLPFIGAASSTAPRSALGLGLGFGRERSSAGER
jgi:capsular exopolysaccharide synthesis family protein